jgi:hypothetical protein
MTLRFKYRYATADVLNVSDSVLSNKQRAFRIQEPLELETDRQIAAAESPKLMPDFSFVVSIE